MKLFTRRRRDPGTIASRPDGDDTRLFIKCPVCGAVFWSGVASDDPVEIVGGYYVRCPNGHRGNAVLRQLFYLDGTRPEAAR